MDRISTSHFVHTFDFIIEKYGQKFHYIRCNEISKSPSQDKIYILKMQHKIVA